MMALPRIEESLGMSGGGSQAHMKNAAMEQDKSEPIAVVGFALKFPQDAVSVEGFWQMLIDGRSAMTEIPQDRWNVDAFYQPNPDRLDSVSQSKMLDYQSQYSFREQFEDANQ